MELNKVVNPKKLHNKTSTINNDKQKKYLLKRFGFVTPTDNLNDKKKTEEISDMLRTGGGSSIMIPDLCNDISFSDGPSPGKKNPWKMFGEFIFKRNDNLGYFVHIRNCKKEIIEALKNLNSLKSTIINNFEVYQSYIFQKFIKGKTYSEDKRFVAFLALTHDKLFFKFLKETIQEKKTREDFESLTGGKLQRIEKHAIFYNQEKNIVHERSLINLMKEIEGDDSLREKLINVQAKALFIPNLSSFNTSCSKRDPSKSGSDASSLREEIDTTESEDSKIISVQSKKKLKQLKKILPKEIHQRLSVISTSNRSSSRGKKSLFVSPEKQIDIGKKNSKFFPGHQNRGMLRGRTSLFIHPPVENDEKSIGIGENYENRGDQSPAKKLNLNPSDYISEESSNSSQDQTSDPKTEKIEKQDGRRKVKNMRKILKHKAQITNVLISKIKKLKTKMPSMSPVHRRNLTDISPGFPPVIPDSKSIYKQARKPLNITIPSIKSHNFSCSRPKRTALSPPNLRKINSPLHTRNILSNSSLMSQQNSTPRKRQRRKKSRHYKTFYSKFASYKSKIILSDI